MAINYATLAKEVSGTIEYIYPKTTASIVEYTAEQTVEEKLQELTLADSTASTNLSTNYYNKTEIDDLLYTVITISASISPTIAEQGSSINVVVSWTCDRKPNFLTIDGVAQTVSASSGSTTYSGVIASKTYTVTATDQKANTASATVSITFTNKIYYGSKASGTINSAFLLSLESSLQTTKAKTFTTNVANGHYAWYACPATYGTPSFSVGGFNGGFQLESTFDFTNASGYTTSYKVYRSQNPSLGNTTIVVS